MSGSSNTEMDPISKYYEDHRIDSVAWREIWSQVQGLKDAMKNVKTHTGRSCWDDLPGKYRQHLMDLERGVDYQLQLAEYVGD